MKFGQLIEYNMKKCFLKKSYTKYGGETLPDLLLKSWNLVYLWINNLKLYAVCFYCMPSWVLSKYIEIKL